MPLKYYTRQQAEMHAINIRDQWPKKKGDKKKDLQKCATTLINFGNIQRYADYIEICYGVPEENMQFVNKLWSFCEKYIGTPKYGLEMDDEEWQEWLKERKEILHRKKYNAREAKQDIIGRDGAYNRPKASIDRGSKNKGETEDLDKDFFF